MEKIQGELEFSHSFRVDNLDEILGIGDELTYSIEVSYPFWPRLRAFCRAPWRGWPPKVVRMESVKLSEIKWTIAEGGEVACAVNFKHGQ